MHRKSLPFGSYESSVADWIADNARVVPLAGRCPTKHQRAKSIAAAAKSIFDAAEKAAEEKKKAKAAKAGDTNKAAEETKAQISGCQSKAAKDNGSAFVRHNLTGGK